MKRKVVTNVFIDVDVVRNYGFGGKKDDNKHEKISGNVANICYRCGGKDHKSRTCSQLVVTNFGQYHRSLVVISFKSLQRICRSSMVNVFILEVFMKVVAKEIIDSALILLVATLFLFNSITKFFQKQAVSQYPLPKTSNSPLMSWASKLKIRKV